MNRYDLHIPAGSTYSLSIAVQDDAGNLLNLSGFNISGFVKCNYSDTGKIIDLGAQITMPTSGQISLNVPFLATTGLPTTVGVYDIEISNGITTNKILRGYAYIHPEVTY